MEKQKITFTTLVAALVLVFSTNSVASETPAFSQGRLDQAKELLGHGYKNKVVRKSEKASDLGNFIKEATKKFLPKADKKNASSLAKVILEESKNYELDPVFLMAVIQNESSFNPKRKGSCGEIGLMQVKPDTAAWIAETYGIEEYKGAKSLYNPAINVRIGAALMDKLRHQFDSESRLYLSAYNIGAKKVRKMVSDRKIPKEYVQAVMKRYMAFYSAFRGVGDSKKQSEAAWMNTMNITRKHLQTGKLAANG